MISTSGVEEARRFMYKPSLAWITLICVGTFFTIPPHDQVRQPLLYKPLLASLFLGISSCVVSLFYGFQWSQPATLEAALLDQDKIKKEVDIKERLLIFGIICTLLALFFRCSLESLEVMAMIFGGSIVVAIPFICVIERHLQEIISQN